MKKIIEEQGNEGLESLLGENVTLFCCRYIYNGKLKGVSETDVLLENASIVYETGSFKEKNWKDIQKISDKWYISRQSIESYGILDKE